MPEAATAVGQYQLEAISLSSAADSVVSEWRSLQSRYSPDLFHDPDWLRGYFAGQLEDLTACLLYQSGSLCGVASFLLKAWPLKWYLGELTLARLPLRRSRMLGSTLNLPDDCQAYDMIFGELAKREHQFDALHLEEVPVDSFLWRYLQTSPLIRRSFRLYEPDPPAPHLLLRFEGSFDEYLKKFSRKHRHELRREVRRIREGDLGEMRFVEYTKLEEVPVFLEPAVEVSKKTYQWNLHQRGLSGTDVLRKRMLFAAERGWLRSYLLSCGGSPSAFLVGFQCRGVFLPLEMGFDPTLSKHSIGTVLQFLVVEHLFSNNPPQVLDLGGYGTWKDVLSTESYQQSKIILFRPGPYTRFVQTGHQVCQTVTKVASATLDRLQWKTKLKKIIRGWSTTK